MFIRTFIGFAILLLVSQASVGASTSPANCGEGTARCCEEDSSQPGSVNDEQCQSYSEPCATGYMPACCYIVSSVQYYYCEKPGSS
ncbi:hypothetical protein BD769DRAFT_1025597 [Suillus cothurnatus]|nr:hypothetical protein BD769DRAFT_1025597 [Suillus cothurnatus]